MKFLPLFLLAVLVCAATLYPQTQPHLPQPLDSLIVSGTDLIMRQEYSAAMEHFQRVSDMFPQSPEGFLFQAAAIQAQAMDFRDFRENDRFDSLLTISRSLAEQMVERDPQSPWGHYYLGTTIGMDSYDRIQRGEYVSGYFKGRSAVSAIEKTLELDSTFYDCYSILGTYYYWKSRKTEFLNWLPFFQDERGKGIQYLHRTVQNGRYQRFPALSNLVWVNLDAQNYAEAETFARVGLQLYPNQRAFLHALASSLQGQNKYIAAKEAFEHLLAEILSVQAPNAYSEIGIRVNIVLMKRAVRDTTQVRKHLAIIFSKQENPYPDALREKMNQHFTLARRFQQELSNGTFPGQK